LSADKVYNAKNNFLIAIPYRKIGRKSEKQKKNFFLEKRKVDILEKVKLGYGCLLFKCPLDMGYMRHG
jgi:hypothetical protein